MVCYFFGLIACMLRMQTFSFNLPLLLATPTTLAIILTHCKMQTGIPFLEDFKWVCPEGLDSFHNDTLVNDWTITSMASYYHAAILFASWVALLVICGHIWFPRQNVLDPSEK